MFPSATSAVPHCSGSGLSIGESEQTDGALCCRVSVVVVIVRCIWWIYVIGLRKEITWS